MAWPVRIRLVTALGIVLSACALTTGAGTLEGRVVGVTDGNTLTLLVSTRDGQKRQEKVRLAGIDAPESL